MNVYKKDDEGNNILGYDGKRIVIGKLNSFKVIQYVYNLSILSPRNIGIINAMIQRIPEKNNYYEPLQTNPQKHAKVFELTPNKPETTIVLEGVETKNIIVLNESQLRAVIAESVKKVLSELYG